MTLGILGLGTIGEAIAEKAVAWGIDVIGSGSQKGYMMPPGLAFMGVSERAQRFAERLLEEGIYVIGFFYPVVPKGEARIRVQVSAAHETEHLDRAVEAFTKVGRELGVLD